MIAAPDEAAQLESMGYRENITTGCWNRPGPDGAPRRMVYWSDSWGGWVGSLPSPVGGWRFDTPVAAAVWLALADSTP